MRRLIPERAHLMCPNMELGMVVHVDAPYDAGRMAQALTSATSSHPELRSRVLADDEGFHLVDDGADVICVETGSDPLEAFACETARPHDVTAGGLLRALVHVGTAEEGFDLVAIANRVVVSGHALRGVIERVIDTYMGGSTASEPAGHESPADLSHLAPRGVAKANDAWEREKDPLTWDDYLTFADGFSDAHVVAHAQVMLERSETDDLRRRCEMAGVSVTSAAVAAASLAFEAPSADLAFDADGDLAVDAAPLVRVDCTGGAGDYRARTSSVERKSRRLLSSTRDRLRRAAAYQAMDPALVDVLAAAALGGHGSDAARRAAALVGLGPEPSGLAVEDLGAMGTRDVSAALLVPTASPAYATTVGLVEAGGRLGICTSSYLPADESQARLDTMAGLMTSVQRSWPWKTWKDLLR
ncbi:MAG: hypothetical protein LKI25_01090 [Atopobiaceae bacterium]|jgi:hypothetical protein|nr:hypothetical protein [Atopobiaceae bacterium]MCI2172809.1 hypothetical protein [Atopobiaceae bacterium]MCI2207116.1 hypothetical protein [Atopobiaceae bacterium]